MSSKWGMINIKVLSEEIKKDKIIEAQTKLNQKN